MKKIIIYFLLLTIVSCSQTSQEKTETVREETLSRGETQTTSIVSNSSSGSGSNTTYTLTSTADGAVCHFKGYWSLGWQPTANITAGFHFEKAGYKINDTLTTKLFSKHVDLNAKSIKIDSMAYKVIGENIKLKFIVSLIRNENKENKASEKHFFVYSSNFKDPKPTIVVDKIEKTSVEIFGSTY